MERYTLNRAWDNWVSARRVLVRNCRWTEKCSDGRAKFFNTLSCLCAFILCSNLLTPAVQSVHIPCWFESIVRNDCREKREWILLIEVYTYFKTYSLSRYLPKCSDFDWVVMYEQCPPEAIGDGIYSWLYLWNCWKPKNIKQNMKNIIWILDLIDFSGLTRLYSTTMFFFRFLFSSFLDCLLS